MIYFPALDKDMARISPAMRTRVVQMLDPLLGMDFRTPDRPQIEYIMPLGNELKKQLEAYCGFWDYYKKAYPLPDAGIPKERLGRQTDRNFHGMMMAAAFAGPLV